MVIGKWGIFKHMAYIEHSRRRATVNVLDKEGQLVQVIDPALKGIGGVLHSKAYKIADPTMRKNGVVFAGFFEQFLERFIHASGAVTNLQKLLVMLVYHSDHGGKSVIENYCLTPISWDVYCVHGGGTSYPRNRTHVHNAVIAVIEQREEEVFPLTGDFTYMHFLVLQRRTTMILKVLLSAEEQRERQIRIMNRFASRDAFSGSAAKGCNDCCDCRD